MILRTVVILFALAIPTYAADLSVKVVGISDGERNRMGVKMWLGSAAGKVREPGIATGTGPFERNAL